MTLEKQLATLQQELRLHTKRYAEMDGEMCRIAAELWSRGIKVVHESACFPSGLRRSFYVHRADTGDPPWVLFGSERADEPTEPQVADRLLQLWAGIVQTMAARAKVSRAIVNVLLDAAGTDDELLLWEELVRRHGNNEELLLLGRREAAAPRT